MDRKKPDRNLDIPDVTGGTHQHAHARDVERLIEDVQTDQISNMIAAVDYLQIIALYYKRLGEKESLWHPDDLSIIDRVHEEGDDDV